MSMKVTRCQFVHGLPCEQVAERISRLESENAELREELADARQIMADELERQISDYRARHIEQALTITELEAENAKLREEAERARDPQRIGGQADPSSFVYAIEQLREFRWQHATNDEDAIPYINNVAAAHERENAKLRELVKEAYACIESLCSIVENSPGCYMCPTNQDEDKACGSAETYCRMRDLGVEVGA